MYTYIKDKKIKRNPAFIYGLILFIVNAICHNVPKVVISMSFISIKKKYNIVYLYVHYDHGLREMDRYFLFANK